MATLTPLGLKDLRLSPGNPVHCAGHPVLAQPFHDLIDIKMLRTGNHAIHGPLATEDTGQGTGINPLDAHNIMFF